jgi:hypothetical protein
MRLNQMTKVDLPKDQDLYQLVKGIEDFEVYAQSPGVNADIQADSALEKYLSHLATDDHSKDGLIVTATQAIYEMGSNEADAQAEPEAPIIDSLTIFSELEAKDVLQLPDGSSTVSALLSRADSEKAFGYIERLLGQSEEQSNDARDQLIMDLQLSTMYQKSEMDESVDIELVSGKILDLVQDIEEKTTGHQGESE